MTSIAEKYAAQYFPNGEVSLADLIQSAINESESLLIVGARERIRDLEWAVDQHKDNALALQQRIRQLESQSVPVEDVVLPIANAYESGIGHCKDNLWNPYKAGSAEAYAYDYGKEFGKARGISQSVPVVGEPVAWIAYTKEGKRYGFALSEQQAEGFRRQGYHVAALIHEPKSAITAAELATLREKAAMLETVALSRCADRIKLSRLEQELETERMRLAACGVIALSNTADSAINARDMLPEYWSASAQDCASAVDREMDYRSRLAVTERERDELRKDAEIAVSTRNVALNALQEIIDMDYQDNLADAKLAATKAMTQLAAIAQGKGE